MSKKCDFCSKRIGLFSPQAQEALKDGLCLCKKCYVSLWKRQADSASQAKNLARLALNGGLRPEIKLVVVKRVKELTSSETNNTNSIVDSADSSKTPINNETKPVTENDSRRELVHERNTESALIQDSVAVQEKPDNTDATDDSGKNNTEGEPIVISYEKLRTIDNSLHSQVKYLWKTLGHKDIEPVSTEHKGLYEQIKDLDENERSCHLIYEAEIDAFLYFRELLNRSNGIKEMILLPLQVTETRDSGKIFLLKPDEITALVHYQHENINYVQAVKKDQTILHPIYKKSGATDFDKFVRDMIFMTTQVQVFTENILELIGVTITEQDEQGRITNIRYNE